MKRSLTATYAIFVCRPVGSQGGGVIQSCASECVLDCLLAARTQAVRALKVKKNNFYPKTTPDQTKTLVKIRSLLATRILDRNPNSRLQVNISRKTFPYI